MENDEELVRIRISRGGRRRSSVSMDIYLVERLKEKLGGEAELKAWVQETTNKLDEEWDTKALSTVSGGRVRANQDYRE